jgi:hypothetical protein
MVFETLVNAYLGELLKSLGNFTSPKKNKKVQICAFSGIAAKTCGGATLHSFLSSKVELMNSGPSCQSQKL